MEEDIPPTQKDVADSPDVIVGDTPAPKSPTFQVTNPVVENTYVCLLFFCGPRSIKPHIHSLNWNMIASTEHYT